MADKATRIRADIAEMRRLVREAIDIDDFNTAQTVDLMIQEAESQLASMGKPNTAEVRQQLESSIEPAGLAGSVFAGINQGFTEDLPAGLRSLLPMASGDSEARAEIAAEQLPVEERFQARTREHPLAAGLGRSAPLFLASGGRTGMGAFLRGAAGGAAMFNPDPAMQGMQMLMGGGANAFGRKLPGLLNKDVARAQQQGIRMTPESRVTSPLDDFVENLRVSKKAGQKVARFNEKEVTKEVLRRLDVKGDVFTDETLGIVADKTGGMFNKAIASKQKVLFGGTVRTRVEALLDPPLKALKPDGKAKTLMNNFLKTIDDTGGIVGIEDYQAIRHKFTTDMIATKNVDKRRAMAEIVEMMDDAVGRQIPPDNKALFEQARRRWRDFVLYKSPGVIKDNGRISTGKLRNVLNRKDESGFMLNRDTSRLNEMLRLDKRQPQVGTPPDPFNITNLLTYPLERSLIGLNRLPTRAVEGAPLAATIPLLRPPVQGRGDDSDELVIRR